MTAPTWNCPPATEIARRIRERELSPVEFTQDVIARIDELNPQLNPRRGLDACWNPNQAPRPNRDEWR